MIKQLTFTQHKTGPVELLVYSEGGEKVFSKSRKKMPEGVNTLEANMKNYTGNFVAVIKTPADRIEQKFSINTPKKLNHIKPKSNNMKKTLTLFYALAAAICCQAQYVFTELNCNTSGDAEPSYLTVFQNKIIFQATDGTNGIELFSSDGTAGGTGLLRDFVIGSGDGTPVGFKEFNGQLFFQSANGVYGRELQSYEAGGQPGLFADIYPGPEGSFPQYFTEYNGRLYFSANDSVHGFELFSTDGVWAHGVSLVKDIHPDTGYSFPGNLFTCNGKLYFVADDGLHGRELWVSDGTDTGTHLVKDISITSDPNQFTVMNNKIYFQANTPNEGTELWVSDGTEAGTVLLKDINPGSAGSAPWNLRVYNSKLYFSADNGTLGAELWCTDGTTVGTVLVKDLEPGSASGGPNALFVFKNKLFFEATDTNGVELWVSDGSVNGTHLFKNLAPGAYSSTPYNFYASGNKMYFTGGTDFGGHFARQAWVSDGTDTGTIVLSPANVTGNAIVANFVAFNFVSIGNDLFYAAEYNSNGNQLWKVTDTTTVNTSVELIAEEGNITLYPNPVSSGTKLFVRLNNNATGKGELKLFDIGGRMVFDTKGDIQETVLPGLSAGTYFAQIRSEGRIMMKKLMITQD